MDKPIFTDEEIDSMITDYIERNPDNYDRAIDGSLIIPEITIH